MSQTIAIVPVRSWQTGKQRLAGVLSPAQRTRLIQYLVSHTCALLQASPAITASVIVSGDPAVLDWATHQGLNALPEAEPSLRAALETGRRWSRLRAAHLLIVLPDLPLLTASELAHLLAQPQPVVLAPDRATQGTNALLLRFPATLPFAFGPGSYRQHQHLATAAGLAQHTCTLPGLAFDLDTPTDLAALPLEHPIWREVLPELAPFNSPQPIA